MNAPVLVGALLVLAVLLASVRMLRRWHRQEAAMRVRGWRIAALLLAQAAGAALLYPVLFPPPVARDTAALVVLTARAGEVSVDASDDPVVALPEAGDDLPAGTQRVPDLASALRRHPAVGRLRVVGTGLVARDRDAARGHAVDFNPAPPLPGLASLQAPSQVPSGRRFHVNGRGNALAGGSAELLDPAGRRTDRAALDDDGRFRLHGTVRTAGLATWRLRLRDPQGQVVDEVAVPLEVMAPRPLRVHVLAGAATPELKYLRRWAVDAGVELESRIDLGAGLQVGTAAVAVDAETLEKIDLLVLDTRSWRSLGADRRDVLGSAVERGLGLVLRLDRPLNAGDRDRLTALGFIASADGAPREVRLGRDLAGTGDAASALPTLTASASRVSARDGVPLLADASATPLAVWRAHGRGRIGVSTFDDSFRLVLAGRDDLHGELWSLLFTTLARAPERTGAALTVEPAVPHQRSVICGLDEAAGVEGPGGRSTPLHVDPASGPDRCAGFWAEAAGWHRVHSGEATHPFYVRDSSRNAALAAQATTAATRALTVAPPAHNRPVPAAASRPGARWPWFLAWLLLATATWWFERARPGRPTPPRT